MYNFLDTQYLMGTYTYFDGTETNSERLTNTPFVGYRSDFQAQFNDYYYVISPKSFSGDDDYAGYWAIYLYRAISGGPGGNNDVLFHINIPITSNLDTQSPVLNFAVDMFSGALPDENTWSNLGISFTRLSSSSGSTGSSGSSDGDQVFLGVGASVMVSGNSSDGYIALIESYPSEYYNKYSESPSEARYYIHFADGNNDTASIEELSPGGSKTTPNFSYSWSPQYNIGDEVYYQNADDPSNDLFEIIRVNLGNQNYDIWPISGSTSSFAPEVDEHMLTTDPSVFSSGSSSSSSSSGSTGGGYGGNNYLSVGDILWYNDGYDYNHAKITGGDSNYGWNIIYYNPNGGGCGSASSVSESYLVQTNSYGSSAEDPTNWGCY